MKEKNYFFIISFPKDSFIEYVTKLNSFIIKMFPGKPNPYIIKPLEIQDTQTISKVTINTTEDKIRKFSERFFGEEIELLERNDGDIEVVLKHVEPIIDSDDNIVKH